MTNTFTSEIVPRKEVERGRRLTSGATGVTSEAVIKHLSSSHKILCKRRVTSCRAKDDGLKKCVGSRIKPLDRDACKKKETKKHKQEMLPFSQANRI